jgi:hypothetical protein
MNNLEKEILTTCRWINLKNSGTLTYSIKSVNGKSLADLICVRNNKKISLTWITTDESLSTSLVELVIDRDSNSINKKFSSDMFKSKNPPVEKFLNMIKENISKEKELFFSTGKLINPYLNSIIKEITPNN